VPAARLAEPIRDGQPCVALTGAGVSTESGVPDFHSAAGAWTRVDPREVASIEALRRDPVRVWEHYAQRHRQLAEAAPNEGHRALADLERRGLLEAVVTQNVDGLHQRAGSRAVVEVHGSLREAVCPRCGASEPLETVVRRLDRVSVPVCPGCGGVLKPGVVLFGEQLPQEALARATGLARSAALLLVVGSSLQVWPVAGLPLEAAAFAIVNQGQTPLDDRALLTLDAPAGPTLAAAASLL
jgi:NAD-dependent deacetylase